MPSVPSRVLKAWSRSREDQAGFLSSQASGFFDRDAEREELENHLKSPPSAILVVLGPISSGKTALLQQVLLRGSASAKGFPPLYLNARAQQLTEPGVLVSLLREQGTTTLVMLEQVFRNLDVRLPGRLMSSLSSKTDALHISGADLINALKGQEINTINDMITVYDRMFEL